VALAHHAQPAISRRKVSRRAYRKVSRPMANSTDLWGRQFDDPIVLPGGKQLLTLRDAIKHLAKTVPRAEQSHEKVLVAADHLSRAAEQGYPSSLHARLRCRRSTETTSACSIQIAKNTIGESAR